MNSGPVSARPPHRHAGHAGDASPAWRHQHNGKARFTSSRRAWLVIFRMWIRARRADNLHPYLCRWTNGPRPSRTAPGHYHIGHGGRSPQGWLLHQARTRILYPYYRARLTVKIYAGRAQAPPDWKSPFRGCKPASPDPLSRKAQS
jgi:hypothetical protein